MARRTGRAIAGAAVAGAFLGSVPARGEPQVRISGSDADGIKISRAEAEVRQTFRVVAMNAEKAGDVAIPPVRFQDESGRDAGEVRPKWLGGGGEVTLEAPRAFEIAATFARPGVYTGDLDLVYAGKRTSTRITVTRTAPPAPAVVIVGSQDTRLTRWPFGWLGSDRGDLDLTLRETEWAGQTVGAVALSSLDLKGGGSDRFQQRNPRVAPWGGAVVLGPGEERVLRVTVGGLDEAGRYEGHLRLDVDGRKPLDVPFTILVKDSGWTAAALIALGVVGSYRVRGYFSEDRKRLLHRRDLLRVARDLDARAAAGDADERVRNVMAAMRRRLDELREDLDLRVETDFAAAIEVMAAKVRVLDGFCDLRARARSLGQEAARGLLARLDPVAAVLVRAGATKEEVEGAARTLSDLDVRSLERDALADAARALEKEAAAAKAELSPEIARVWQLLNRDQVEEARSELDRARLGQARALAAALRDCLDGRRPRGFDDAGWDALRASLAPRLDEVENAGTAEAASAAYEGAAQAYVAAAAAAMMKDTDVLAEAVEKRAEADRSPLEARLDRAKNQIQEAMAAAAGPSWREGAAMTEAAEKELDALELALFPMRARAFFESTGPVGWAPGVVPEMPAAPGAGRRREASPERVAAALRSYDAAVTAFILVVAVATGIKLLWAGNDTWGGLESWLVAFLWGLGLHQVGSAPFEGLLGLRDKLGKAG